MDDHQADYEGFAQDLRRLTDIQLDTFRLRYPNNPLVYAEWQSRQFMARPPIAQNVSPVYVLAFDELDREEEIGAHTPLVRPSHVPTFYNLGFDDFDPDDPFAEPFPEHVSRMTPVPDEEYDVSEMITDRSRYPGILSMADVQELQRDPSLLGTVTYSEHGVSRVRPRNGITVTERELNNQDDSSDSDGDDLDNDNLEDEEYLDLESGDIIGYRTTYWEDIASRTSSFRTFQRSSSPSQTSGSPGAARSREIIPALTRSVCQILTSQQDQVLDEMYPRQNSPPVHRPSPLQQEPILAPTPANDAASGGMGSGRSSAWPPAAQYQTFNGLALHVSWEMGEGCSTYRDRLGELEEGESSGMEEHDGVEDGNEDEETPGQGFVDVDGEWEGSATSSERTELRSWNGKVRRGSKCPTLI